jgi:DNA-binding LacI/PurR family transcriptional regulator
MHSKFVLTEKSIFLKTGIDISSRRNYNNLVYSCVTLNLKEIAMQISKHTEITRQIEKSIRDSEYDEMLPTVRLLSDRFKVSTRTLSKALKPLVTKGLIIPDGTRGCLINRQQHIRPQTGIVGIFYYSDSDKLDFGNATLLAPLKNAIEQDGYKPLFMNAYHNINDFGDINFWKSNWVDGYIFIYSAINKKLACSLKKYAVPFVVANSLPPECGANWVEFDSAKAIRQIVDSLYAKGYRKIGIDFKYIQMSSHSDYIKDSWKKITSEKNIYREDYFHLPAEKPGMRFAEEHAGYFLQLPEIPEALILWHPGAEIFEREFARAGIKYPDDIFFVEEDDYCHYKPGQNRYPVCLARYDLLAREAWSLFKQIKANPEMEAVNKLIDFELNPAPGNK